MVRGSNAKAGRPERGPIRPTSPRQALLRDRQACRRNPHPPIPAFRFPLRRDRSGRIFRPLFAPVTGSDGADRAGSARRTGRVEVAGRRRPAGPAARSGRLARRQATATHRSTRRKAAPGKARFAGQRGKRSSGSVLSTGEDGAGMSVVARNTPPPTMTSKTRTTAARIRRGMILSFPPRRAGRFRGKRHRRSADCQNSEFRGT